MTTQRKPEWVRQVWVCHYLERVVLPPLEVRSIDQASAAMASQSTRLMARARFVKSGTPDIWCWQGNPFVSVAIEVKHLSTTSDAQRATARALRACGVHVVEECRTTHQALSGLRSAGMRLHANADNLAVEYQERMEAGLRELAEHKPAKKRATRAERPTPGRVARMHKTGIWRK